MIFTVVAAIVVVLDEALLLGARGITSLLCTWRENPPGGAHDKHDTFRVQTRVLVFFRLTS